MNCVYASDNAGEYSIMLLSLFIYILLIQYQSMFKSHFYLQRHFKTSNHRLAGSIDANQHSQRTELYCCAYTCT
jgi:hypothetical protein